MASVVRAAGTLLLVLMLISPATSGELETEVLRRSLRDGKWEIRAAAARSVGERQLAELLPSLILGLDDADTRVRVAAADAIGALGPRASAARQALREAARTGSEAIRAAVPPALGAIGPQGKDLTLLAELLEDDAPEVRAAAARSLALGGEPAATWAPALVEQLADRDEAARLAAAGALRKLGSPVLSRLEQLLRPLNLPDETFPAPAETPLARLGPELVPLLVGRLQARERLSRQALDILRQMGPDATDAIPALAEVIRASKQVLRVEACRALAATARSEAARPLAGALRATDAKTRIAASRGLAGLGQAAAPALPELLRTATNTSEPADVRRFALRALSHLHEAGGESVVAALSQGLGTDTLRSEALTGLARIGPPAGPVAADVERLLIDPKQPEVAAASTLAAFGPAGLPGLILGMEDNRAAVRVASARALATMGPAAYPAGPWLVRLLEEDPAIPVQQAAAAAMAELPGIAAEAGEALFHTGSTHVEPEVRVVAVRAMRHLPDAAGQLARLALEAGPLDSRLEALQQLARLGPAAASVLEPVVELSGDPFPRVRSAACRMLGAAGHAGAVPSLVEVLRDSQPDVRTAAANALADLGPLAARALPGLQRALFDAWPGVQVAAARAVKAIGPPAASPALPELRELFSSTDAGVRLAAVRATIIVGQGDETERPRLARAYRPLLADPDTLRIRLAAAVGLQRLTEGDGGAKLGPVRIPER